MNSSIGLVGVVKVLSIVENFFGTKIFFFENFWFNQSNPSNFRYPRMLKITRRYLLLFAAE